MVKKESGKNGLIELFRFLCSIWVAYFHRFLPLIENNHFDGVNISVDFFFMVSGLFFLRSIEKYKEKPLLDGIRYIFVSKVKGIMVPLIIAALSVLWCNTMIALNSGFNFPFSFLWFFLAQFAYLSIIYVIFKVTKRISTFNLICAVIIGVTLSSCIFGNETLGRVVRGIGMIALGMFVAKIPKINIKSKGKMDSQKLNVIVNAIGFSVSAIAFIYLAYLPEFAIWKLHVFLCIVCTSLLYFALSLPVHSKFLNLLGELSVFIYLAQCPILLHYYYISTDANDLYIPLIIYALALFAINRVVNKYIRKRKAIA